MITMACGNPTSPALPARDARRKQLGTGTRLRRAHGAQSFLFPPEQVFWIKDRGGDRQAKISLSAKSAP
jgi:hypothetical protein